MTPAQYNEYQRQADVIDEAKRWEEERKSKGSDEISKVAENTSFDNLPKVQNKDSFGEILEEDEKTNSQRFDEFMDLVKSSQTEISDEEIYKVSFEKESIDWHDGFIEGAKWYREQLNSRK